MNNFLKFWLKAIENQSELEAIDTCIKILGGFIAGAIVILLLTKTWC